MSKSKSLVAVVMLGSRMNYAIPRILNNEDMLEGFYTDGYLKGKCVRSIANGLSKTRLNTSTIQAIASRYHSELDNAKVISSPFLGLADKRRRAKATRALDNARNTEISTDALARMFRRNVSLNCSSVYAVRQAALEVFEFAKSEGMKCVLEQSLVPQTCRKNLLYEEFEKWGHWVSDVAIPSDAPEIVEREQGEWDLADWIIAPSEFVVNSLKKNGVQSAKIVYIPFGVDIKETPVVYERYCGQRPFRVLFAGHVNLRKGAPYLLEAMKEIPKRQLDARFAGEIFLSSSVVSEFEESVSFLGRVPRSEMRKLFQWADVLILPSLAEGSAAVVYEAFACGVPVITTPNSGSLVRHDRHGFLVSAGSVKEIKCAIECYIRDPERLRVHANNMLHDRECISYERYKREISDFFARI